MASLFQAIAVGQGDAFFLCRDDFTSLIDGGRSKQKFPKLFLKATGRNHVDVIICTHNDADHARGIAGFLQSPSTTCCEVWLPHIWTARLNDLIGRPSRFVEELADDISKQDKINQKKERKQYSRLQDIGNLLAKERFKQIDQSADRRPITPDERNPHSNDQITQGIAPFRAWRGDDNPNASLDELWDLSRMAGWRPDYAWSLLQEAILAAENISIIVASCMKNRIPIRWFEYNNDQASGGEPKTLEPLNSVEIAKEKQENIKALEFLALTTANRTSLTFCSPGTPQFPGVVFSADSDLQFSQQIPWKSGMIVTAPHHGSENNALAYRRVKKEMSAGSDVIWVRSDGRYRHRPGASFLCQARRFCTNCRGAAFRRQDVEFSCSGGRWIVNRKVKSCPCTLSFIEK